MAKKKEKNRNKGDELQLEMTPMIDVVFQLLIFFIVTLNQPDILSTLDSRSSDWGLQPDPMKLDSLVIAHQPWRGEYVPGPCTHRPRLSDSA